MANNIKLSPQEIKYYTDIDRSIKVTADDDIDADTWDTICRTAQSDVYNHRKKRTKASFNSEVEYKLYLLSVYSTASLLAQEA